MTQTGSTSMRNKAFIAATWLILILIISCSKTGPTATPLPSTVTPVEATASPVPPAATRTLRTATSMPPTDTPITLPSTATPLPPTHAPAPETTATPLPPLTGSGSGTIAFISDRDGDMAVYTMNADGSQVRRVAGPNPGGFCCCPAWSPDGERIAYPIILSERNEHGAVEIWVTAVDGSEHVCVSDIIADELQAFPWPYPTWSPDGTQIAFYAMGAGDTTSTIYIVQAHGGGVKQSIPLPYIVGHMSWSPAGDRLLLLGGGSNGGTNAYILSVEEEQVTEVYSGARAADWSPDGTEILVAPEQADELFILEPDGTSRTIGLPEEMRPASIDWSPNGTYVAIGTFPRHRQKIVALYVIAVETGELVTLIEDMGDIYSPNWSPDGNHLLFTSTDDSRRGQWPYATLWSYDTTSDELQQLTSGEVHDGLGVWSPWQPLPMGGETEPATATGEMPESTRTRPADGMTMVYVPGGTFLMGSTDAQLDLARALCDEYPDDYGKCKQVPFKDEAPQHAVTLDSFWLDRTEVTNAQYALCVADGACHASRLANDPGYNGEDYPVAGIPWQDAADYCAWAGGRPPTEAEWEYAARGTKGSIFPWGDEFDCAGGNFWDDGTGCDDGYPEPAPVGSFPEGSSWCGALDMAGNVWEWVADAYGPYPAESQENPTGPTSGGKRILRGGSWGYLPAFVRTAYRYPVPPTADYLAVGFRCIVPATE